jgi:uncharacterized protein (DUF433 family)
VIHEPNNYRQKETTQMQNTLIVFDEKDEPVIEGTGISVAAILEGLDAGDTVEDISNNYDLTRQQIHAALQYAERSLPHSQMDEMLHVIAEEAEEEDELDYSLLSSCMC